MSYELLKVNTSASLRQAQTDSSVRWLRVTKGGILYFVKIAVLYFEK